MTLWLSAVIALLSLAPGSLGSQADSQKPTDASLSGSVLTTGATPQPVRGAIVLASLLDPAGPVSSWGERTISEFPATITDDEGHFVFLRLPPGHYRLSVTKASFLATEFGAKQPGEAGTPIAIGLGERPRDVVIRLTHGAVITGTVRDLNGQPAVGAIITARPPGRVNRDFVLTDDHGRYRIFGLKPGEYYVAAEPAVMPLWSTETGTSVTVQDVDAVLAALERQFGTLGPSAQAGPMTNSLGSRTAGQSATGGPSRPFQNAPVLYPGTTDEASAVKVSVRAGETCDGIDFRLVLAGTVQVSGVVLTSTGQPAAGVRVAVSTGASATDANGAFHIDNVSPGHQTISARMSPLTEALSSGRSVDTLVLEDTVSRGTTQWAMAEVDVSTTGLSNLTLTLRPGMTLSGRVVFDGASTVRPDDPTKVRVSLTQDGSAERNGTVQSDGSFRVGGILPGGTQITASVAGVPALAWWLRGAMLNGRDLLDLPLEFDATTGDVGGVVLTLSNRHTDLSGTIENIATSPGTFYWVAVLPSECRLWHSSRRLVCMRPSSDGRFAFHDLPAGDYILVMLTDLDAGAWRDPAFLEQLLIAGVKVTLGEEGRVSQNLRIIR